MKAIDLQTSLAKAPIVGREQQIQQSSSDLGQRGIVQQQDQERILDQTRTQSSEETEQPENRVDDHEGRQHGDRRERRPSHQTSEEEEEADAQRAASDTSRIIDVVA